jgi:hypothetical protein
MFGATNVIQFTQHGSADDKRVRKVCIYFNFIDFCERKAFTERKRFASRKQNSQFYSNQSIEILIELVENAKLRSQSQTLYLKKSLQHIAQIAKPE